MPITQLCTLAVLKIAIVNVAGGLLFGYAIGFVGPYSAIVKSSTDCPLFVTEVACSSLPHGSNCRWSGTACEFVHSCAALYNSTNAEAPCSADSQCSYSQSSGLCENITGFNPVQLGLFASGLIFGAMASSMLAGIIIKWLRLRRSVLLLGIVATLGAVLIHISEAVGNYPLLIVGRILIGFGSGLACVACPMYCNEAAPESVRNPIGVFFQLAITFGIVLAALIGLLVDPDVMGSMYNKRMHYDGRLQAINAPMTLFCVLTTVIAFAIPAGFTVGDVEKTAPLAGERPVYTVRSMLRPLTVAVIMSIAQQFTGINAIINYAPNITKAMRLKPLLGNFLVGAWNFVTTIFAIPIASRLSLRRMFLSGTLIASLACLLTGIPVFPGVASITVQNVLAGLGIFIFIMIFEFFMGPSFFILAQQLFPAEFRDKGSSWTVFVQFVLNLIINFCFPIAVTALSGGPSGDQNRGLAITFIFFGGAGLLSWLALLKFLQPYTPTRVIVDAGEHSTELK